MIQDKKLILGLDVSTTCIGCSLMLVDGDDKKILKVTSISPKINKKIKGVESLFLKKQIFEDEFLIQYKDYGITDVVIEAPLVKANNVNVVVTLLQFNGMISDSIYRLLGIVPAYISSYDSRKYAFNQLMAKRKFNKKGERISEAQLKRSEPVLFGEYPIDCEKKRVIFDLISEQFPEIEWSVDKNNELVKTTFDSSDSLCCILGWLNKQKEII